MQIFTAPCSLLTSLGRSLSACLTEVSGLRTSHNNVRDQPALFVPRDHRAYAFPTIVHIPKIFVAPSALKDTVYSPGDPWPSSLVLVLENGEMNWTACAYMCSFIIIACWISLEVESCQRKDICITP